jgi:uncharacterized membrane protein
MWILLACLGLLVLSVLLYHFFYNGDVDYVTGTCALVGVFSGLAFLGLIFALPIVRMEDMGNVVRYKAFAEGLAATRAQGAHVEDTGLQRDVLQWRAWRAARTYWNGTQWDWWVLDEVETLPLM